MKPTLHVSEWFSGLPNKLTVARVASLPFLIFCFLFDVQFLHVLGAMIFLAAAITDFLDGFFARKYQMQTPAGALLDPIADKLLVLTGLILLVPTSKIVAVLAIVLLGREFAISGLRLIALERHFNIEVSQLGKVKTGFQVAGIFSLMVEKSYFNLPFSKVGMLCLWVAVGLSLYSGYQYWQNFQKNLK